MNSDLRFPVGRFKFEGSLTEQERLRAIDDIAEAPARLISAVEGLSDEQLDTPYRPDGWTVRQVVHHLPDSHLNSYTRFKLALTEDEPTIKPYDENLWANLDDGRIAPIDVSLALFESLHRRFVLVLKSLGPQEYARTFRHPEIGVVTLEHSLGLYAWHSRHHVAHITSLRTRMGWA
jgi:uncharacterized damage-inducible protein DinB